MQFIKDHNHNLAPPRATDPGWAHGTMVNGGRQKIKCKYCHKIFLGGGISRLKQHLAGERGNVTPCEEVPEDVKVQIQQHLGFKVLEKLRKQKEANCSKNSILSYFPNREEDNDNSNDDVGPMQKMAIRRNGKEVLEGTSNRSKRHKKQRLLMPMPVVAQNMVQNFASQESIDQADIAVARFIYEAGVQLSAANLSSFQHMADSIADVGPGYKMPSYNTLRGKLLNKSVLEAGEYCTELRSSWEATGCSVLVDRWMDKINRTVVDFFVYCPKGIMFLKSVDTTDITESSEALLNLFDSVVHEVGPKNIVNFVTDTSPSYKTAGKLLAEKYKIFFSSTCGAQCIDLMLEEISKRDEVKVVLAKAKRVTQFIYNNAWVLNLMRKKTCGRGIIQLAKTRFASIFLSLQTIVSFKSLLQQMFTCNSWTQSPFSKKSVGNEVAEILVDPLFWSMCDHTLDVAKPLLSVLHLMDFDNRPSMGYVYDAMEKVKKSIIAAFDNTESEYASYLKIIDHIWQEEFHSPLHAAACHLNPAVFYNNSRPANKVIQKGLLDCIETLEPSLSAQVTITSHLKSYEEAVGDFGRPVALRGRESLAPATWWSLYATDYPDLQRFAIRVLSQTCSITQFERSRSMLECIQSMKRNRLEHQRSSDLKFVRYNLFLQERQAEATKSRSMRNNLDHLCLDAVDTIMGDWLEDLKAAEAEEISLMNATMTSEQVNYEVKNTDDSNESTDDRSSDLTKGLDGDMIYSSCRLRSDVPS